MLKESFFNSTEVRDGLRDEDTPFYKTKHFAFDQIMLPIKTNYSD